jgi:hypothetical protein
VKKIIYALALAGSFTGISAVAANSENARPWSEVISSDQGQYSVSVIPQKKKIEVKKIDGGKGAPPHLRVRMLRPNDRPLELRLKTVERVNSPVYYTGTFSKWNDSFTGVEVDFSFDKKTWKRLGNTIRKILP